MLDGYTVFIIYLIICVPAVIALGADYYVLGRARYALHWFLFSLFTLLALAGWSLQAKVNPAYVDPPANALFTLAVLYLLSAVDDFTERGPLPKALMVALPAAAGVLTLASFALADSLQVRMVLFSAVVCPVLFVAAWHAYSRRSDALHDDGLGMLGGITAMIGVTLLVRGINALARPRDGIFEGSGVDQAILLGVGVLFIGLIFTVIGLMFFRLVRRILEAQHRLGAQERLGTVVRLFSGLIHDMGSPIGNARSALSVVRSSWQEWGIDEGRDLPLLDTAGDVIDRVSEQFGQYRRLLLSQGTDDVSIIRLAEHLAVTLDLAGRVEKVRDLDPIVDCPPGLYLNIRPVPLFQIVLVLLHQAAAHATKCGKRVVLRVERRGETVEVRFEGLSWPDGVLGAPAPSITSASTALASMGLWSVAGSVEDELSGSLRLERVADRMELVLGVPHLIAGGDDG